MKLDGAHRFEILASWRVVVVEDALGGHLVREVMVLREKKAFLELA